MLTWRKPSDTLCMDCLFRCCFNFVSGSKWQSLPFRHETARRWPASWRPPNDDPLATTMAAVVNLQNIFFFRRLLYMFPKCEVLLLYSMHTLWQIWRFRSFETQPFRMPKILPQGFIRILSKWFQGNPSLLKMLNVGRFGRHGVFGRRASLCSLDSAHRGGKNILIKCFATQSLNLYLYTGKQKDLKGTLYTSPTLNPCPTRHENYLQS